MIGLVPARVPPMLWASLGRPCRGCCCPKSFGLSLDAVQQDAVLAHELAHLKRRDHWVRRLEAVVLGLYWWDPVAWWARRQLERAEEECCDAWVVWSLPSAAGAYAEALVATAAFLSGLRHPLPLGASGAGRTLPLKRRLKMILRDRPASPVAHGPTSCAGAGYARLALPARPGLGRAGPRSDPPRTGPGPAAREPAETTTLPAKTDGKVAGEGIAVQRDRARSQQAR